MTAKPSTVSSRPVPSSPGSCRAQGSGGSLSPSFIVENHSVVCPSGNSRILLIVNNSIDFCGEEWTLPGMSPVPTNEYCHTFVTDRKHPQPVCLNHAEHPGGKDLLFAHKPRSCHRRDCPECFMDWVNREKDRIVDRLRSGLTNAEFRKVSHVTVSFPESMFHWKPGVLIKKAVQWLMYAGHPGGCVVFHAFRYNHDVLDKDGHIIFYHDPRYLLDCWYYSPHCHVLGTVWFGKGKVDKNIEIAEEVYDLSGGIVIKKILPEKGKDRSVPGTVWYELNHCGVHKTHRSVSWFGKLGYGKVEVHRLLKEKLAMPICPYCGQCMRLGYVEPTLEYWDRRIKFKPGDNWVEPGILIFVTSGSDSFTEFKQFWSEDFEHYQ